jgi:electron transfer flavoprotein alpha subunit
VPELDNSDNTLAVVPIIAVLVETHWGKIQRLTYELLSDARKLAASLKGKAELILLGSPQIVPSMVGDLAPKVTETINLIENDALGEFSTEGYLGALSAVLNSLRPSVLFLGATANGRDFAPRLAARLRYAYFPHCLLVKALPGNCLEITRVTHGGRVHVLTNWSLIKPIILSMRSGVADAVALSTKDPRPPDIRAHSMNISASHVRIKARIPANPGTQDIREAERLVSGGKGVGGKEEFVLIRELADALGAGVAASRAAVDLGWIEYARQVGQTGKAVTPRLYLAAGISGASHHLAGMRDSQKIVALNTDRKAPIFTVAHLGAVGDLHQVLPRLTQKIKTLKGGRGSDKPASHSVAEI